MISGDLWLGAHRQRRTTTHYRVRRAGANFCPFPQCNIGNTTRRKAREGLVGLKILKQPGPSPAEPVRLQKDRRGGAGGADGGRNQSRCEELVKGDPSPPPPKKQCEPSIGCFRPIRYSWPRGPRRQVSANAPAHVGRPHTLESPAFRHSCLSVPVSARCVARAPAFAFRKLLRGPQGPNKALWRAPIELNPLC